MSKGSHRLLRDALEMQKPVGMIPTWNSLWYTSRQQHFKSCRIILSRVNYRETSLCEYLFRQRHTQTKTILDARPDAPTVRAKPAIIITSFSNQTSNEQEEETQQQKRLAKKFKELDQQWMCESLRNMDSKLYENLRNSINNQSYCPMAFCSRSYYNRQVECI